MKIENIKRTTGARVTINALRANNACKEAIRWANEEARKNSKLTAQGLWNKCPRGEWLVWIVDRLFNRDMADANLLDYVNAFDEWVAPIDVLDEKIDSDTDEGAMSLKAAVEIRKVFESPWMR